MAEFAIVTGVFVAVIYHPIYRRKLTSSCWDGRHRGLGGMRWKQVGFARPRSWGKAFLVAVAAGIGMELLELFVSQMLLARRLGKMPDQDARPVRLRGRVRNQKMFLIDLVLVWTPAALGEEIVYRGYLMKSRGRGVSRNEGGLELSLIAVSVIFG